MPITTTVHNSSMNSINNISYEERFYNEPFFLSYSGLNRLLYSPKLFYNHYILGMKEDKLDLHLVEGKLVHCLILEPEKFSEQFIIAPGKVPKDNAKIIVDSMYALLANSEYAGREFTEFDNEILELMMSLNYYQNLKTDAQRLEKVYTDDNVNYFRFLQEQSKKVLIDEKTYEKCKEFANEIINDKFCADTLYMNQSGNVEIYNESYLQSSTIYGFGLKGFIDRMIIDHDQLKIQIVDIKTTSKPIDKFKETVEYYRYDLQASIYKYLATEYAAEKKLDHYIIDFRYVVIDPFKQVYSYGVSPESVAKWDEQLKQELHKFNWHYVNKNFNLPYELAKEVITL